MHIRQYIPERVGWRLLMTMLIPNIVVSEYTSCLTSVLLENRSGYCFRAIIKTSAIARPTSIDVTVATTTENFAVLGCAAPSSFDTLTLHNNNKNKIVEAAVVYMNWSRLFRLQNLIAALNPRATMIVQPNIFMLQKKYTCSNDSEIEYTCCAHQNRSVHINVTLRHFLNLLRSCNSNLLILLGKLKHER